MNIQANIKNNHGVEIESLLEAVLQKSQEFLWLQPKLELKPAQQKKLNNLIKKRKQGKPLAYLIGHKYFYGLKFKTTPKVLIPRPETEQLVTWGVKLLSDKKLKIRKILDIGTGSGCIAISLAAQTVKQKNIHITAGDISHEALKIAKINAHTHKVQINFRHSDLFSKIYNKFDLIFANLPYVPFTRYRQLTNLKYEPAIALTDKTDDWQIYDRFFMEIPKHLNQQGIAFLEIDEQSKPALTKMLKKHVELQGKFSKDLNKSWRYLKLKRK